MHILVTGGSGFIGAELVAELSRQNMRFRLALRKPPEVNSTLLNHPHVFVKDLTGATDWNEALLEVDVVIHAAARAHIADTAENAIEEFRKVNTYGTLQLARQAAQAKVKRFIYISSIGVNGSHTNLLSFNETHKPRPDADYAISKLEAEQGLLAIAAETSMEVVIIRPPLVYAYSAPGNFGRLLRLSRMGLPLPFANVKNSRSFIALENLVNFITLCVIHPKAANEIFLIADGNDISTSKLIRTLAKGMNKVVYLFPAPAFLLKIVANLIGKKGMYQQLYGNLQVDITKAKSLLGWSPVVTTDEALLNTARDFKKYIKK